MCNAKDDKSVCRNEELHAVIDICRECNVSGVIVCQFVPHGRTVTADYHRGFLQRQLRHAVREKYPDPLNSP